MRINDVEPPSPYGVSAWQGVLLGSLAVFLAFLASKSAWFDPLPLDRKVEFWVNFGVAAGTLLLAVFTAQSVRETKEVLRGEDRRHQQGYAPFITLGDSFNNNEEYQQGITAHNIGKGFALNIEFEVVGSATKEFYKFPEGYTGGISLGEDPERAKAEREKYKVVQQLQLRNSYFCSALWEGGSNLFYLDVFGENFPLITRVRYSAVTVRYTDMFGNQYQTIYEDDMLRRYRWVQPRSLRPDSSR